MERERWAIVGGGMLGLTLARRLAQAGRSVTLFEAAPEIGGLASAWTLGERVWDRHYHVTLLSDSYTRGILAELGLDDEMRWVETKTGLMGGGRLYPMSNSIEYLKLPVLGMIDKLRLAATIVHGSRIDDWERLETIGVEQWLTKCSGKRVFERLWRPLLLSKLGENYKRSAATFIWATIRRLYAARRSGLKKEMFGYVPGGYARTFEHFARALAEQGVDVRLNAPVERVVRENGVFAVETGGVRHEFERVVVTTTPNLASRMCANLSDDERARLAAVPYQGIVCASLLLRRPLAENYLTYLLDDGIPFTAVVEMSAFVDREQFGGNALVYLPKYVASDDALFGASDDDVRASFEPALARLYPDFRADDVLAFRVSRVREVFPIPTLGYSKLVLPFATSQPGLFLVNSSQIVNGTLNVNDTVQLAERAARELCSAGARAERVQEVHS